MQDNAIMVKSVEKIAGGWGDRNLEETGTGSVRQKCNTDAVSSSSTKSRMQAPIEFQRYVNTWEFEF